MAWGLVVGCGLIGFSPLLALFLGFIVHQPYLLILSIGGAFFWLIAALLSGALWFAFAMTNIWILVVIESLFFQEIFRWAFWFLYNISLRSKLMSTKANVSKIGEEVAIGSGIAAAHALIMFGSILWDARGPGSFYIASCPHVPVFFSSAVITCLISILDVCWTIIAYEGYRSRSIPKIVFVILSHFVSSFLTILNTLSVPRMCWLIFVGEFLLVLVSLAVVYICITTQRSRGLQKIK